MSSSGQLLKRYGIVLCLVEAENTGVQFTTSLKSNQFEYLADEPVSMGGKNLGPSPGDYLCMALASCEAMTLRMYIQRKQWDVETINVKVSLSKRDQSPSGVNTFYSEISVKGNIDDEQLQRMLHIAKACPFSRLLQKQNKIETTLFAK